jgi:hypothetical protein
MEMLLKAILMIPLMGNLMDAISIAGKVGRKVAIDRHIIEFEYSA